MTRLTLKDLIKADLQQSDFALLGDEYLNAIIDISLKQLQGDLLAVTHNFFNRTYYFTGSLIELPSNFSGLPSSIISVRAAIGTQDIFSINTNGTADRLTITVKEPKATSGWTIVFVGSLTATCTVEPYGLTLGYNNGVTTHAQIIAAMVASPQFNEHFITPTTNNSSALLLSSSLGVGFTPTTAGTGNGWIKADEVGLEEKDNLSVRNSIFKVPSAQRIMYTYYKDDANKYILSIYPPTVRYGILHYVYTAMNVSSDSDNFDIPLAIEPLLVCLSKYRAMQGLTTMHENLAPIYEKDMLTLNSSYRDMVQSLIAKNIRLKTEESQ